ncbi:MAG: glycosyltransferase family 1 protein, partial [Chlamydiota bacterium]
DSVLDGETGFLVDPERPGELCRRLRSFLGDRELRRRMGDAGSAMVSARRWEECARELRRICARCIEERGGAR